MGNYYSYGILLFLSTLGRILSIHIKGGRHLKDIDYYELGKRIQLRRKELVHIAKLNGRLCGAKRPHSVSEQPNFYQSLQSNPYNDSSHPSGGE